MKKEFKNIRDEIQELREDTNTHFDRIEQVIDTSR